MDSYRWVYLGPDGDEVGASESFRSQAEAEEWLGREWPALLDEGAEAVSLTAGEREIYRMGLREG